MPGFSSAANLLTAVRLFATPFIIGAIVQRHFSLAFGLFVLAAVTDALDGSVARHFHAESRLGAWLDPVADKVLMSGIFLALALAHIVPWWYVGIVFGRDLFILGAAGCFLLFTGVRQFPPSRWGKLSTFVQILTAGGWFLTAWSGSTALEFVSEWLLFASAAITVWSGADYARQALGRTRNH
jgi:cardiolipin synthase (CMP-forming)